MQTGEDTGKYWLRLPSLLYDWVNMDEYADRLSGL